MDKFANAAIKQKRIWRSFRFSALDDGAEVSPVLELHTQYVKGVSVSITTNCGCGNQAHTRVRDFRMNETYNTEI